jgi:hypothetical protein
VGLKRNYKITTLKEYLKMEKVDNERLLDRLNDEVFTFMHQ